MDPCRAMDLPKTELTATARENFIILGQKVHHAMVFSDDCFSAASPAKSHLWPLEAEEKVKRQAEDTVPTALPPPSPKI